MPYKTPRGRAGDFVEDYHVTKDRVRRLELRDLGGGGGPHVITHNFIVGGPITTGLFIPPAYIHVPSGVEVKWYGQKGAYCRIGGVTVNWEEYAFGLGLVAGGTLMNGSKIRAIVSAISGTPSDMTAWYTIQWGPIAS